LRSSTWHVRAEITRWVNDDFPGFVECRFKDRFDREWTCVEKAPVVSSANLSSENQYPQPAFIACEVLSQNRDESGREITIISTEKPWSIESLDGTSCFQVFTDQLTTSPR